MILFRSTQKKALSLNTVLSKKEIDFLKQLHLESRKKEFLASHKLLHYGFKKIFKKNKVFELKKNKKGFWQLIENNINFSISHCNKEIFIGYSKKKIGVDIQNVRKLKKDISKKICHKNELQIINQIKNIKKREKSILKLFSIKEAIGKSTGAGLTNCLKIDLSSQFTIKNEEVTFNKSPYFFSKLKNNFIYSVYIQN